MWREMLTAVSRYRSGELALGKLVSDLRGLYVEADPHYGTVRDAFEAAWSTIDAEHELRTEAWAPKGSASDANLGQSLDVFTAWVERVLNADDHEPG